METLRGVEGTRQGGVRGFGRLVSPNQAGMLAQDMELTQLEPGMMVTGLGCCLEVLLEKESCPAPAGIGFIYCWQLLQG